MLCVHPLFIFICLAQKCRLWIFNFEQIHAHKSQRTLVKIRLSLAAAAVASGAFAAEFEPESVSANCSPTAYQSANDV